MRLRVWLGEGHWTIAADNDPTTVLECSPNVQINVPSQLVLDSDRIRGHLLCNGVVRRVGDVVRIERR